MGPNVTVPHVDDYNFASALLIFFFNYLFALQFFLVWLENGLFFDFLVKTVLLLLIMLVPVLSIQYYLLTVASFLTAALCWSICVWILNKSPKRHLPRVFLFRFIHSPPLFVACMP
jgi:hypothetical protein